MNSKQTLSLFFIFSLSLTATQFSVFEYTPLETEENLTTDIQETTSTKAGCDLNVQIGSAPSAINIQPFLTNTPPFRITSPGQYCLTVDITVPANTNGIIIETSNVSINLNGKRFTGVTNSGTGIIISGNNRTNITIENGMISNMGTNAIQCSSGGQDIILRDLTLCRNNIGINMAGLRTFIIENCLITSNRSQGIFLSNFGNAPMQNGVINNCLLAFNNVAGIQINQGQNIVLQNVLTYNNNNPGTGILETNGNRITFENCQANNNNAFGFATSGLNASFSNCAANNNNASGFVLTGNRTNISVCQAKGNQLHGFSCSGNNITIASCSSKNNTQNGFLITGNQQSYENCDAVGNLNGFNFSNANHCILNCLAKTNASFGFLLQANSANCQVRNNTALTNGTAGFQNNSANINFIYSNFASNNGTPPAAASNFVGIANVFTSPVPGDAINFTTNISN